MRMHDWNGYRSQVITGVGNLAKISPDTVRGYTTLSGAGAKTGKLDAKTRELISLAVAVTLRCDGCITVHADAARKLGVAPEELAEALGVAVAMNAGATIIYSTRAFDAFQASADEQSGA